VEVLHALETRRGVYELGIQARLTARGRRTGLVVATGIWVWLALVDAVAGEPFRTFTVLGGIASFVVVHYLLNVAYGVAVLSLVHGAAREPSLIIAVGFGFVMVEFAFAMVSVILSRPLGARAWIRIFGGSLAGALIAIVIFSRRHALVATRRRAEDQR
jgi:hypothetical protein